MVRTRGQNPNGIQSPLQSMDSQRAPQPPPTPSPPRGAVFPPGIAFFYDENVGLYDDDVSTLDLEGSVRSPSPPGARAVIRSPSAASDGMVHIGYEGNEGDDKSEFSEPAVDIILSDDEEDEEDDSAVIIIPDDDRSVISISSNSTSGSSDDDISDLDLAAGDDNDNENEEEDEEVEDAFRTPPPPTYLSSPSTNSPNRAMTASPSIRNISPDHAIFSSPSPPPQSDSDPDRTISNPSTPNSHNGGPASDPDRTESPSPLRFARDHHHEYEDEDEEMTDDGIVDFQGPDLPPYVNQAPSHFERRYRGVVTIWSVEDWEREGPVVLAEEAEERQRERVRRRRWANNGGRSRLARQRAWRERQRGAVPRARVNGRFA